MHEGFDYWIDDVDDPDGVVGRVDGAANAAANPTARLTSVEAAYWTAWATVAPALGAAVRRGARCSTRWPACTSPARTRSPRARGSSGCSARTACSCPCGTCRSGTGAEVLEEPAARFASDLAEALADDADLTTEERAARSGLANRQVTIR